MHGTAKLSKPLNKKQFCSWLIGRGVESSRLDKNSPTKIIGLTLIKFILRIFIGVHTVWYVSIQQDSKCLKQNANVSVTLGDMSPFVECSDRSSTVLTIKPFFKKRKSYLSFYISDNDKFLGFSVKTICAFI